MLNVLRSIAGGRHGHE